ncbi:MAG: hypothetical protein HYR62_02805 [Actinobacteria bacterium]|nr:hypothetical protein [Actinomycetota bacterium]MBI3687402.1 hypothetical protein [Actinomycetota bacterium]
MHEPLHRIDHGTRTIDGVPVRVTELVWPDGGRSVEVHRTDTAVDLTADGCFDTPPTDTQIRALLHDTPHTGTNGGGDDEPPADSPFGVYRCEAEVIVVVPPLLEGDPVLDIHLAAAGGGTPGRAYADTTWLYEVHLDGTPVCSGADLRSGGIPHTHTDMAAVLAVFLATDPHTPPRLRPHTDRLTVWAENTLHPGD